jgi:hypothetical protein
VIGTILNLEQAKKNPAFHSLADTQKFEQSVGRTIGVKGVLSGLPVCPKPFSFCFQDGQNGLEF